MYRYRINLYPEYFERRRAARTRLWFTSLLATLAGVGILLIAALFVSAYLLQERCASLEGEIQRLSEQVAHESRPGPELEVARQMLDLRRKRLDWSPKLAALSRRIGSSVKLQEVTGETARKGQPTRLELVGVTAGEGIRMEPVQTFIDGLRADPAMTEDFANIKLENVKGGGSGRFQIVCLPQP